MIKVINKIAPKNSSKLAFLPEGVRTTACLRLPQFGHVLAEKDIPFPQSGQG